MKIPILSGSVPLPLMQRIAAAAQAFEHYNGVTNGALNARLGWTWREGVRYAPLDESASQGVSLGPSK